MQPDVIFPAVAVCAMLWWVSRGMSWTTRLAVAAVTLAAILAVLLVERGGF